MLGSCSATGSPGLIPMAVSEAASRSEAWSSSRYVSWPPANTTTGRSGDECADSLRMTARLKLMAASHSDAGLRALHADLGLTFSFRPMSRGG